MLKPDQQAALEAIHARYFNDNQDERDDFRFMAANGHPYAANYRMLRTFFDTLKYACGSSARYFSYLNPNECTQFRAPGLMVNWNPLGFAELHHVHPAKVEEWQQYLGAAAKADWPAQTRPSLHQPAWIFYTENTVLWAKLNQLACVREQRVTVQSTYRNGRWEGLLEPSSSRLLLSDQIDISMCLARYQGELPKRCHRDDQSHQAERPLAQKTFH